MFNRLKGDSFLERQTLRDNILFGELYKHNVFINSNRLADLNLTKFQGKDDFEVLE